MVADGREEFGDVLVVQPVAHSPPDSLRDHEPELTQDAQLLRDRARVHLDHAGQLLHGPLPVQ